VRGGFDDFDGDIVAAEAVDEAGGGVDAELFADVVLDEGVAVAVRATTGAGRREGRCWPSMR
jgi:hypothetical protein